MSNATFKTLITSISFTLLSLYNYVQGQSISEAKEALYKIMLDFPNQFQSLKESRGVDPDDYISKIWIPDVDYCIVHKNQDNGTWEWQGTIADNGDEPDEDEMEKEFKRWKVMLDNMDLGGVRLVGYNDGRYNKKNKNATTVYEEGYAWRLDNSRNNIDVRYQKFTIRLECTREDDHLEVKLIICDN